jgi:hypothetical protein
MSIFHVRIADAAHPRLIDVTLDGVSGNASDFIDAYLQRHAKTHNSSPIPVGVCVSEAFGAHTLHHMCLGGAQFVCLSSSSSGFQAPASTARAIEAFFLGVRRLLDKMAPPPPPLTHEQLLRQPLVVRTVASPDITRQMRLLMDAYNTEHDIASPSHNNKLQAIHTQVEQLRASMDQNIELVRGNTR